MDQLNFVSHDFMLFSLDNQNVGKPAIVFLHGGGLSSKSWTPIIDLLPDFHCLAPDLPEQGVSKDIPFTMGDASRGVAELIEKHLPQKKAHVVGLSLGGAVALALIRTTPDLVDHCIVTGCSGRLSAIYAAFARSTLWTLRFYKPEYLVQATMHQQGIPTRYHELLHDDLLAGSSVQFMNHIITSLKELELPAQIDMPLLVCVGERENWLAKRIARGLLARFPSARGLVAPGGSHVWCLQFPGLFADMVRAWVTDKLLPPSLKPL
ncbi:MAG: alpha/beta hydrolase [Dehalococcoidia bacterium]